MPLFFSALNVTNLDEREPIIYHGYTLTSKLPFREVIHTIKVAYYYSLIPRLIVLLHIERLRVDPRDEMHTSHPWQAVPCFQC